MGDLGGGAADAARRRGRRRMDVALSRGLMEADRGCSWVQTLRRGRVDLLLSCLLERVEDPDDPVDYVAGRGAGAARLLDLVSQRATSSRQNVSCII